MSVESGGSNTQASASESAASAASTVPAPGLRTGCPVQWNPHGRWLLATFTLLPKCPFLRSLCKTSSLALRPRWAAFSLTVLIIK